MACLGGEFLFVYLVYFKCETLDTLPALLCEVHVVHQASQSLVPIHVHVQCLYIPTFSTCAIGFELVCNAPRVVKYWIFYYSGTCTSGHLYKATTSLLWPLFCCPK